jgi:beta-galactosidase/beta-glucuronidase
MNKSAQAGDQLHPNPQFGRKRWQGLCGTWAFAHDDADVGRDSGWAEKADVFNQQIIVPYPPESKASGIEDRGFHPVVWYRRTFEAPQRSGNERVILHFGAVDYVAEVWVNGGFAGRHEGGHTPFRFDITPLLNKVGEQIVVVRAEDPPEDVRFPRGKQDWLEKPHNIWYHRTTGIWQPVWLEVVPRLHLTDLHWTPDLPQARVRCEARLSGVPNRPVTLRVKLANDGVPLAEQSLLVTDSEVTFDVAIPALQHGTYKDHLLWTPERPNLIDATVTLDGDDVDEIETYLGLRSCEVGAGHFLLNGLPYYLRMVLGQNYWPDTHLASPAGNGLRREVELIKRLGFNGVRIHQKIEDPRFLYWCDRLGVLVWEEMPSAYAFSASAVERLSREWIEAIRRDKSHPCIVAWVPLNESWGVQHIAARSDQNNYASALYHLTKALDPSRPVISNDGWELVESDIWSVHDYAPDGKGIASRFHRQEDIDAMLNGMGPARRRMILDDRERGKRPVMLTEFGGLSFLPKRGDAWHGYSTVDDAQAYEARLADLFGAVLAAPLIAGFCYTQLTDTEQETNGLLTAAREPKLPFETIHAILTQPAASVPYEQIDAARQVARAAAGATEPIE